MTDLTDDDLAGVDKRVLLEIASKYGNALRWIRHIAYLHYMGEAFDPERMRHIADMASDALTGDQDHQLPDYEEEAEKALEEADRMVKAFGLYDQDEEEEDLEDT